MSSNRAFTLLELLVVITIIGILASIVVVSMSGSTDSATIAKGKAYAQQVHALLGHEAVLDLSFNENAYNTCSDGKDVCDASGYGNNGIIYNNEATFVSSPVDGYALSFDGVDDYVDCGNEINLNVAYDITVELWATGIYEGGRTLISKGSQYFNNDLGYSFQYASSPQSLYFNIGNGTSHIERNMGLASFDWTYLAFTRNSAGVIRTYKNGAYHAQNTLAGDISNNYSLLLGENGVTSRKNWNGLIDDVRVYSEVIPTTEIQKHYVQGLEKLLANQAITQAEYTQRIEEFNQYLASI
jgi:prepilin-type N-terminal cleavage/methylation domain-containing protein